MSSLPGLDLEDYLSWAYDVVTAEVDGNTSLRYAEAFGTASRRRPVATPEQFKGLTSLFEHLRETIEYKLSDFDEDNQSWRDYAGYAFDFVPDELDRRARDYLYATGLWTPPDNPLFKDGS